MSTVDYKKLGEMLTTMWSRNYHAMSTKGGLDRSALTLPSGAVNMQQFEAAVKRYKTDKQFQVLVASTVGSIMAVVQECDKGGPGDVEV